MKLNDILLETKNYSHQYKRETGSYRDFFKEIGATPAHVKQAVDEFKQSEDFKKLCERHQYIPQKSEKFGVFVFGKGGGGDNPLPDSTIVDQAAGFSRPTKPWPDHVRKPSDWVPEPRYVEPHRPGPMSLSDLHDTPDEIGDEEYRVREAALDREHAALKKAAREKYEKEVAEYPARKAAAREQYFKDLETYDARVKEAHARHVEALKQWKAKGRHELEKWKEVGRSIPASQRRELSAYRLFPNGVIRSETLYRSGNKWEYGHRSFQTPLKGPNVTVYKDDPVKTIVGALKDMAAELMKKRYSTFLTPAKK